MHTHGMSLPWGGSVGRNPTSPLGAGGLEVASVPFPTLFQPFSLPGRGLPLPLSLPPGLKRVVVRVAGASSWRFLGHSVRIFFRNAFQLPRDSRHPRFWISKSIPNRPKIYHKSIVHVIQVSTSIFNQFLITFHLKHTPIEPSKSLESYAFYSVSVKSAFS